MKPVSVTLVVLGLVGLAVLAFLVTRRQVPAQSAPAVDATAEVEPGAFFDDSAPGSMRLTNANAEIVFSKENGAIQAIIDRTSGENLIAGSVGDNLWKIAFNYSMNESASSNFSQEGTNRFQYEWAQEAGRLTFQYLPGEPQARAVKVSVTITSTKDDQFDLVMVLQNDWGYEAADIRFPALAFQTDNLSQALLPILPGVVLGEGFFARGQNYETTYPGYPGVFADFAGLDLREGKLALFSTTGPESIVPVFFGFNFSNCQGAGTVCLTHSIRPRVKSGATWQSPTVHLRVGEEWDGSIHALRADSGIATSPSVAAKLGSLYEQVAGLPLYKADADQLGLTFAQYPDLLAQIRQPGILHLVAYQPGGFDRNYPDFLPPDSRFGSVSELEELAVFARSMGFLVMPYINPTWWDGKSPTLSNLPEGTSLRDVVVLTDQGMQWEECYGCPANPHYGYAVSPSAPFVRQRLESLLGDIERSGFADLLFEDQIGARAGLYDYNPHAEAADSYLQHWINHTQQYARLNLATESGFDQLVPSEVGFHGSFLLSDQRGETLTWWGEGTWHYYPFATQLARDKSLFYQHNLAPETFTHNRKTLAWNVAMGYMLSYDLFKSNFGGGILDSMLEVTAAFQRFALSTYASEPITAFSFINENVSMTSFEKTLAYVNWDARKSYAIGDHSIPGNGFFILKKDGSLSAGIFTRYNQQALSSGDHYLIEERAAEEVTVRQPKGEDTPLLIRPLSGWEEGAQLIIQAYDWDGLLIETMPARWESGFIQFDYRQKLDGVPVAYYRIAPP